MDGSVSLEPAGTSTWTGAALNRPLTLGDKLWADRDSRAEIDIGDAVIRLGSTTGFSFLNLDEQTAQMQVTAGTVIIHVTSLDEWRAGRDRHSQCRPDIAATRHLPGGGERQRRHDHREGRRRRRAGHRRRAVLSRRRATERDVHGYRARSPPNTPPSALRIRSTSGRCSAISRSSSRPRSRRNTFRPTRSAGMIWALTAAGRKRRTGDMRGSRLLARTGRPTVMGSWAWVSPWGWTWVDDEPWGYAPFHYGRWGHWGHRWCWVPGPRGVRPVYSPAMVAWVGGAGVGVAAGARVGWLPLGPGDAYGARAANAALSTAESRAP